MGSKMSTVVLIYKYVCADTRGDLQTLKLSVFSLLVFGPYFLHFISLASIFPIVHNSITFLSLVPYKLYVFAATVSHGYYS